MTNYDLFICGFITAIENGIQTNCIDILPDSITKLPVDQFLKNIKAAKRRIKTGMMGVEYLPQSLDAIVCRGIDDSGVVELITGKTARLWAVEQKEAWNTAF